MSIISLYEAKTHLSSLVDKAASGEEIIIAKNGVPQARLGPLSDVDKTWREPAGTWKILHVADDFDAPDEEINALFYESKLFPDDSGV